MFLIFILLTPNILLALQEKETEKLLLSVLILSLYLSIVKTTKGLIILVPFVLITPCALYYTLNYKTSINEQIIGIILETNTQELLQFFGFNIYIYIYPLLIYFFVVLYFSYTNFKKPIVWKHRSRKWVLILCSLFIFLIFMLNKKEESSNMMEKNIFLETQENEFIRQVEKTYPFGLFFSLYNFYHEKNKINQAFEINKNYKFNIKKSTKTTDTKQLFILVIGETSRRHNWSLNGYQRETNPFLNQQKNLVNFDNMLSLSTATRSSIPMMITRKPAQQVYRYDFSERSIISAFKEAGFSTYWISTQQKFGAFDTSTSVYAKEADHMLFLNKTSYSNKGDTDEIIIPEFKKAVRSTGYKKFIVIHTLGSHYNYSHRYADNFDIFRPSLNDIKNYSMQDKRYKTELLNSYDNSIVYTDYFLNELIEILKMKKDTESFVFFASDHGEDLFDNECNKSGHGNTTIYNYEIASFAWYSDLYQQRNPAKINWLEQNKQHKINQTSIFPTLIDAANLKIPNDSLDKSILKDFKNYPRFVEGGIDFDKTQPQGVCKEIQ